ncbi:hypothetical protein Ahy_B09g098180 [Arachis hypogaea]|uniref:Reverse transcriptase zinc-binding domain-containing protein n=1 Tax=Arachis hypogaea TaxID=3818 RepID=A0A444XRB8_ARAHY|nr:hypothetical protein Ahy_B09g098180 [Arachis hypogaea]
MAQDDICRICENFPESVLYVLCDCRIAYTTWKSIDNSLGLDNFFNKPLQVWLLENLSSQSTYQGISWPLLFSCIMNTLWFYRNKYIFEEDRTMPEGAVYLVALRLVRDYAAVQFEFIRIRRNVVSLCLNDTIDLHGTRTLIVAIKDKFSKFSN